MELLRGAEGVGWAGARLLISPLSRHHHANIWPCNLWRLGTEEGKNVQTSHLTAGPVQWGLTHFFSSPTLSIHGLHQFWIYLLTLTVRTNQLKFHCSASMSHIWPCQSGLSRNIVYIFAANLLEYFRSPSPSALICPLPGDGLVTTMTAREGRGRVKPSPEVTCCCAVYRPWEPGGDANTNTNTLLCCH